MLIPLHTVINFMTSKNCILVRFVSEWVGVKNILLLEHVLFVDDEPDELQPPILETYLPVEHVEQAKMKNQRNV